MATAVFFGFKKKKEHYVVANILLYFLIANFPVFGVE
jgi:hypothetical protein